MTPEKELEIGKWLKSQETGLEIKPFQYFDLIELLHNYWINQLSKDELLPSDFKKARLAKDLTLIDVQELTGISNAYLSQLENEKIKNPSYYKVRTLQRIYNN